MADAKDSAGNGIGRRLRVALETAASVAVIVGALALVFQTFFSGKQLTQPKTADIPVPRQTLSLEGAGTIGDSAAKAVLLEFSDFECPFCGKFATEILPDLEKRYIQGGRLLLAFRHLPLKIHKNAWSAALAASCAAEQQKFGAFHDLLFANSKGLNPESLSKYAAVARLQEAPYRKCLETTAQAQVKADTALASSLGITGTPSFLVGTLEPGGQIRVRRTMRGAGAIDDFVSAIEGVLSTK